MDPALQKHLIRYKGKEETRTSGNSIFQRGYRMIYANPVPIANACQMHRNVVRDTMDAINRAIVDLITVQDRDINLAFGFCNIIIRNKGLQVPFADYLTKECDAPEFEGTMKRMNSPVASLWKTNTSKMFQ